MSEDPSTISTDRSNCRVVAAFDRTSGAPPNPTLMLLEEIGGVDQVVEGKCRVAGEDQWLKAGRVG
jgi:hypothetical protein